MAIAWQITVKFQDDAHSVIGVQGVRTDSTDPDNPRTYPIPRIPLDEGNPQATRGFILDSLQKQHTDAVAAESDEATKLNGWAANLATAMDEWEVA